MIIEQTMTVARAPLRFIESIRVLAAIAAVSALVSGCATDEPRLVAPEPIVAPYNSDGNDILWAVVPLRNESGTLQADADAISDRIVVAAEEVHGVRALPLNRTKEAMRILGIPAVRNPGDARQLAQAMGVDGVLVGSITAYDPYTPAVGLSLALIARPGGMGDRGHTPVDPRRLAQQAVDPGPGPRTVYVDRPLAVISEVWDGKNHQVLADVKQYAFGRSASRAGEDWTRYTRSMALFTEFAAYRAVDGLIRAEWIRLAGDASASEANEAQR